ncbi:hypothetical protein SISNIDRAFT_471312 [Sistotremastrum niveocremeum HHB9708]|uniref:Uncharacterized protein n=1 Tax=Sistotremastrum niveocremeum HHB9708 TaxID=1314777 RepID=A0A164MTZ9_9AGAM|nr:hypothetical protein SISNIDRAFT_471312 [Sistotremastrum niveocremeum HHB9708]
MSAKTSASKNRSIKREHLDGVGCDAKVESQHELDTRSTQILTSSVKYPKVEDDAKEGKWNGDNSDEEQVTLPLGAVDPSSDKDDAEWTSLNAKHQNPDPIHRKRGLIDLRTVRAIPIVCMPFHPGHVHILKNQKTLTMHESAQSTRVHDRNWVQNPLRRVRFTGFMAVSRVASNDGILIDAQILCSRSRYTPKTATSMFVLIAPIIAFVLHPPITPIANLMHQIERSMGWQRNVASVSGYTFVDNLSKSLRLAIIAMAFVSNRSPSQSKTHCSQCQQVNTDSSQLFPHDLNSDDAQKGVDGEVKNQREQDIRVQGRRDSISYINVILEASLPSFLIPDVLFLGFRTHNRLKVRIVCQDHVASRSYADRSSAWRTADYEGDQAYLDCRMTPQKPKKDSGGKGIKCAYSSVTVASPVPVMSFSSLGFSTRDQGEIAQKRTDKEVEIEQGDRVRRS